MNTPRWLQDNEQQAWRAWLEVMRLLPAKLEDPDEPPVTGLPLPFVIAVIVPEIVSAVTVSVR